MPDLPDKDIVLADAFAAGCNVMPFVSMEGDEKDFRVRRSVVLDDPRTWFFGDGSCSGKNPEEAVFVFFRESGAASVNIRSFRPGHASGNPFAYDISDPAVVAAKTREFLGQGLSVIVNELIDVADGGISGTFMPERGICGTPDVSGVVEFAPGDTPRCVEHEAERLPLAVFLPVVSNVWGRNVAGDFRQMLMRCAKMSGGIPGRVEFSLHPRPCGVRKEHAVLWQYDPCAKPLEDGAGWAAGNFVRRGPFSAWIGDKAFGLLLADAFAGLMGKAPYAVPWTMVLVRGSGKGRLAPFVFGEPTGSPEVWTRTCPAVRTPGVFATFRGWHDPVALMESEDPDGTAVASCLVQQAVPAKWSGAAYARAGKSVVEGVPHGGENYMIGTAGGCVVPETIREAVIRAMEAVSSFGGNDLPVRIEWAFDGTRLWILQLHFEAVDGQGEVIVDGSPKEWRYWEGGPLGKLADFARKALAEGAGVEIAPTVGLASHVADTLRAVGVPSRRRA